jgi:hypothetical protein
LKMNVGVKVIRVFRVRVFWAWFLGCCSDALLAEGDVRACGRPADRRRSVRRRRDSPEGGDRRLNDEEASTGL